MLVDYICDKCDSEMEVTYEGNGRYLVHCPCCGEEWYIDDDGEYINDNSYDDRDPDYELANFCRGGDLDED